MPEIRREAACARVDYLCDACGRGIMFALHPCGGGRYQSECSHCHHRCQTEGSYPRIEHGAVTAIVDVDGRQISGAV